MQPSSVDVEHTHAVSRTQNKAKFKMIIFNFKMKKIPKVLKESFMIQSVQASFIQFSSSIEHSLCKCDGEQPWLSKINLNLAIIKPVFWEVDNKMRNKKFEPSFALSNTLKDNRALLCNNFDVFSIAS